TMAPGVVEEVIKDRLDEILLRPNLDHFCDASIIELIEIPADDLPRGVAQGCFLKQAMLAPLSQDVEDPFQRTHVVFRTNRPVTREFRQAGEEGLRVEIHA